MGDARERARERAQAEVTRWETAISDVLLAYFDRQEAVVVARLSGVKARKHTRHWEPAGERKIDSGYVVDVARWVHEGVAAVREVLRRLLDASYSNAADSLGVAPQDRDVAALDDALDARLDRVASSVLNATKKVQDAITAGELGAATMDEMVADVQKLYADKKPKWAKSIARTHAASSMNEGAMQAAMLASAPGKQWLSSRDDKVRASHRNADGQTIPLLHNFRLGGVKGQPMVSHLFYPGDPNGPLDEVMNCRCTMLFVSLDEAKAMVRTAAGARKYGQPIGTVIVKDEPDFGLGSPKLVKHLEEFESNGGFIDFDVRRASIELDQYEDLLAGEPFLDTPGPMFTRYAIETVVNGDVGMAGAELHLIAAYGEGVGIAGALDYYERDLASEAEALELDIEVEGRYLYVDYLGTTGTVPGTGTTLAVAAARVAAELGLPVMGSPVEDAIPFWTKMGWKPDPLGQGIDLWGWTAEEAKTVAAA